MMLVGILWAVLAPLLLVLAAGLLARLLQRTGWSRRNRWLAGGIAVCLPVAAAWASYRAEFREVCVAVATPRIHKQAAAEGIFLDSPTASSFGMGYLDKAGFEWIEIRSVYARGKFERITRRADGSIDSRPIDAVSATYEVRETFEQPYSHTGLTRKQVIDRRSNEVIAEAGSAHFSNGPLQWVLGMYGTGTCPDAYSDSDGFDRYYHLAQYALGRSTPRRVERRAP